MKKEARHDAISACGKTDTGCRDGFVVDGMEGGEGWLKKHWGMHMYRMKTPPNSVLQFPSSVLQFPSCQQWEVVQKHGLIRQNPG